jgi:hypothetical protein
MVTRFDAASNVNERTDVELLEMFSRKKAATNARVLADVAHDVAELYATPSVRACDDARTLAARASRSLR